MEYGKILTKWWMWLVVLIYLHNVIDGRRILTPQKTEVSCSNHTNHCPLHSICIMRNNTNVCMCTERFELNPLWEEGFGSAYCRRKRKPSYNMDHTYPLRPISMHHGILTLSIIGIIITASMWIMSCMKPANQLVKGYDSLESYV